MALTFDACETQTPSRFDERILGFLVNEKIPFTLFVSGKFARRNSERLAEISKLEFAGVENHSLNHVQHMEGLKEEQVIYEVRENETLLDGITARKTKFFRFPGGHYDEKTLSIVERMGYQVVHWTFASGDAGRHTPRDRLYAWVTSKTKAGSILIFHINGRGYHTGEILPGLAKDLRQKGYEFVRLEGVLNKK
jgi:peptidoglycan/xylan/chitin deacetylase (PgdA/CDA1 family)